MNKEECADHLDLEEEKENGSEDSAKVLWATCDNGVTNSGAYNKLEYRIYKTELQMEFKPLVDLFYKKGDTLLTLSVAESYLVLPR